MARGSKPGERRGGRQKGARNKVGADVRLYAQRFTKEAIDGLVSVMRADGTPPAARVGACVAVLDRGWGKPAQAITGPDGTGPVLMQWLAAQAE